MADTEKVDKIFSHFCILKDLITHEGKKTK